MIPPRTWPARRAAGGTRMCAGARWGKPSARASARTTRIPSLHIQLAIRHQHREIKAFVDDHMTKRASAHRVHTSTWPVDLPRGHNIVPFYCATVFPLPPPRFPPTWPQRRTRLDDDRARPEVQLQRDKGNVGKVEDLRAMRDDLRPQLGCRVEEVDEAILPQVGHLGAKLRANHVIVSEGAVLTVVHLVALHGEGGLVERARVDDHNVALLHHAIMRPVKAHPRWLYL